MRHLGPCFLFQIKNLVDSLCRQQLLAAQPTALASICEEADAQLEESTGAPELPDGIGHRWPLKEFIILFRGPKWVIFRWSWCRLHACHTVAAKQEFWQLGTSLQFAVLEKLSCAVPDEHSVHLHCMHLFKRHKYLLFIDQFIVDIYTESTYLKKKKQDLNQAPE